MRLLAPFFSTNSKISIDFIIKFNIEKDTKKLLEAIVVDAGEVASIPGLMTAIFYDVPKIIYNTYTFSRQGSIHEQVMSKLKGKRMGVQPHYHEKHLVIRQGGFRGVLNFDKARAQFE